MNPTDFGEPFLPCSVSTIQYMASPISANNTSFIFYLLTVYGSVSHFIPLCVRALQPLQGDSSGALRQPYTILCREQPTIIE